MLCVRAIFTRIYVKVLFIKNNKFTEFVSSFVYLLPKAYMYMYVFIVGSLDLVRKIAREIFAV